MFETYISIIVELCISFVLCILILLYYARSKMNILIFITSLICWSMNLFLIILIPYDVYYTQTNYINTPETTKNFIELGYQITYWVLFVISWVIIPIMKEYEKSGEFTVLEKFKASLISNLKFFITLLVICVVGIIFCIFKFGGNMTFLLVKNFSLIYGLFFFFFLLAYGLTKYPKTLYLKFKYDKQISYLEWKANKFNEKLGKISHDLFTYFSKLNSTVIYSNLNQEKNEVIDENKNKNNEEEVNISENLINEENSKNSTEKSKKIKRVEDYSEEIKQKISDFDKNAHKYGIDLTKQKYEKMSPIIAYNELIDFNCKISSNQADSLRLQSRLRNCYKRWAKLNTIKYLSQKNIKEEGYDKIEDDINEINIGTSNNIIKEDKDENKKEKKEEKKEENKTENKDEPTLEDEGFIPLENFNACKLLYFSAIKKYFYIVLLVLSILAGVFIILFEFCIVCGFKFIALYKKIESIVAVHFSILIPLIYLISMSNYTLFKIKISSYLFMYGPRQTDSVSLITFSSYLSRIYFAICLNYIQAINQFSKYQYHTKFETFFGFDNFNFILYFCRYNPILLFIFFFLFLFNIPGKILNCCGYSLFEFENEQRNLGIENGHEYLMKLNKKLNGKMLEYTDTKIFDDI